MPVVISLLGYTMTMELYKNYTLMHEVADTAGFITIYPEHVYPGWNTGLIHEGMPSLDTTVNDVGFISALIDTLDNHYNIDLEEAHIKARQGEDDSLKSLGV